MSSSFTAKVYKNDFNFVKFNPAILITNCKKY